MSGAQLRARIAVDPAVTLGKPVIRGTRLTADFIVDLLAHDVTVPEILAEYRGLAAEDVSACLLFAARVLGASSFVPASAAAAQMRFLVHERTGPAVAQWLRECGHDAASLYDDAPGIPDEEVMRFASKMPAR